MYIFRRKFPEAEAEFQGVLNLCPEKPDAIQGLVFALFQQDKFAEAAQQYEALQRYNLSEPQVYYNYSLVLKELGRKAEAVATLKKARELGTGNAELLVYIASSLVDLGELVQAHEVLTQVKEKLPKEHAHLAKVEEQLVKQGG